MYKQKERQKMGDKKKIDEMIHRGETDAAIAWLNDMIAQGTPPADRWYYLLGNAYRKQGDFSQAQNCYMEAMDINPESPAAEAHRMLTGIIEFYHKDYYNP